MELSKKYDVFISYSRADYLDENNNIIIDSPTDIIIKAFDNNNIKYWIDIDGENASNQYMSKIVKAISCSEKVIFISSKNSNNKDSYWPIQEILYASEQHKEIVPIKIDNCEFNDNIALSLAGLDIVEYYKNSTQSIEKLLKRIAHGKERKEIDSNIDLNSKIKFVLKSLLVCIVAFLSFFAAFFTIGFCVGFFPNLDDEKTVSNEAFRNTHIKIVNNHTVKYEGDKLSFIYDIDSDIIDFSNKEQKLFDEIKFEKIMMAVSIPLALDRLSKSAKYTPNSKAKPFILAAEFIGILFGYGSGEDIGKNVALLKNEGALENYIQKESTKQMLRERIEAYYLSKEN